MIKALEILVDGSLNRVTLPELGSFELPLQLCCRLEVPLFGQHAFFFPGRTAQIGAPGGAVHTVRHAHTLFACVECLFFFGSGIQAVWLHTWPCDNLSDRGSIVVTPLFSTLVPNLKPFPFSRMYDMHASAPCLPPMNVTATWRNRHIASKKWHAPVARSYQ